jgi:hypothetical protein
MRFNKRISNATARSEDLVHAFFDPEIEKDHRLFGYIILGLMFSVGIVFWINFLHNGKPGLNYADWRDVNIPRLLFLQQAIRQHVFPWHMSYTPALHGTDRFFSLPDVITSPQIFLLAFLKVRHFVYFDILFYYTIAVCSMIWIKKHFNLSLAALVFFFFLFNFNGYLIAHYSIGHFTWSSHFLFPLFFILMIRFSQGVKGWRWVAATAFLMFYMVLAGGEHQFVWLLVFMALMIPAHWRRAGWLVAAMLFAGLLSAVRLIPPVLELERFSWASSAIPAGYPSVMSLVQSMVQLIKPVDYPDPLFPFRSWEITLFVGIMGAMFIYYFGLVKWIINLDESGEFSGFILPVMGMVFFALSDSFSLVKAIPFPLFGGERVSARMIDVPFVFLLIVAVFYFQKWLNERKHTLPFYAGIAVLFLWMVHDLYINSTLWSMDMVASISDLYELNFSQMNFVSNHPDPAYFNVFYLGLTITLISMAVLIFLSVREYRQKRSLQKDSEIKVRI